MLRKKLDDNDLDLAFILQDPILFPEFLRSTKDASVDRSLWPKEQFKYRSYQRDLLTDQNQYIAILGGRSIGKCQVSVDKVYTEKGYLPHSQLFSKRFRVWSVNKDKELELKRAMCVRNGKKNVIQLTTQSGYAITATYNHPVWTQHGYKELWQIKVGDQVMVARRLPHVLNNEYDWNEARLLGYLLFQIGATKIHSKSFFTIKSRKAQEEIKEIARVTGSTLQYGNEENTFRFTNKRGNFNPVKQVISYFQMGFINSNGWQHAENILSRYIMEMCEANVKTFLEGVFSQYGNLTAKSFAIDMPETKIAQQFQELLLRFGIETKIVDTIQTETYITKRNKGGPHYVIYPRKRYVRLENVSTDDALRFWYTFQIPGYKVDNVPQPSENTWYRYDPVVSLEKLKEKETYAIQVEGNKNYISGHIHVHNSLVMEDMILNDLYMNEKYLPNTPEMLLATANQNQITPILDRLVARTAGSPLLSAFNPSMNRQKGTLDFTFDRGVRLYARIAGSKQENNMIGMHVTKAYIDEA